MQDLRNAQRRGELIYAGGSFKLFTKLIDENKGVNVYVRRSTSTKALAEHTASNWTGMVAIGAALGMASAGVVLAVIWRRRSSPSQDYAPQP